MLTKDDIDVLELNNQAALTDFQYIYLEYRQGLLEEDTNRVSVQRSLLEQRVNPHLALGGSWTE